MDQYSRPSHAGHVWFRVIVDDQLAVSPEPTGCCSGCSHGDFRKKSRAKCCEKTDIAIRLPRRDGPPRTCGRSPRGCIVARDEHLLDVATEFRRLPDNAREELFDPRWGHYTAKGNEFVAKRIHDKLKSMSEFGGRLSTKSVRATNR